MITVNEEAPLTVATMNKKEGEACQLGMLALQGVICTNFISMTNIPSLALLNSIAGLAFWGL